MKLLIDENLSARLARALAASFPGSEHVSDCGLGGASDAAIWQYAGIHGFTIVTKDDDFESLAFIRGAPPKVVWIRAGNASTAAILAQLQTEVDRIRAFGADPMTVMLVI